MKSLLFLAHRLPYPPNKGDKLRSFHLIRHLAERYRIFLGTFVDDPQDIEFVEGIRPFCADIRVEVIRSGVKGLRGLTALCRGHSLTLAHYRSAPLKRWIDCTVDEHQIDTAFVFCSAMGQFVHDRSNLRIVADLVDVDSAKWSQYARSRAFPFGWIFRRESRLLLAEERLIATRSARTVLVSAAEAELFRRLAPESANRIGFVDNGVDACYFDPALQFASPYSSEELPIVFTGAMDYWPNIDAARRFARDVMPKVLAKWPRARFYIVGMRPTREVKSLAGKSVVVTGSVPDTRPFLRHARVAVAPLRVARGVQNKVLEAMAMGRPVVVSDSSAAGIDAVSGRDLHVASDEATFVRLVDRLFSDPDGSEEMGRAARLRIIERYTWDSTLARIDQMIDPTNAGANRQSATRTSDRSASLESADASQRDAVTGYRE